MFSKYVCNKTTNFIFVRNFNKTLFLYETHYDILNLPRDCSSKEIRNSFLKLSKAYHPDKNREKDSDKKFIKISEAYNVLSKSSTRREYDLGLSNSYGSNTNIHVRYAEHRAWSDESIWEYRDKGKDDFYKSKPYYGVEGVSRVSNTLIVLFCFGFTAVGVLLQFLAIQNSLTLSRDKLEQKSTELEELHTAIRSQALQNGDKKQIEILKQKLNFKGNS